MTPYEETIPGKGVDANALPDPVPDPRLDPRPNPRALFDAVRFLLDNAAAAIGPGDIASTAHNHKQAVDKLEASMYPDFTDPLDPEWPALQPTEDSKRSAALGKPAKTKK